MDQENLLIDLSCVELMSIYCFPYFPEVKPIGSKIFGPETRTRTQFFEYVRTRTRIRILMTHLILSRIF
jgi:hypothetical protein